MSERYDRSAMPEPQTQQSDILKAIALILSAADRLSDGSLAGAVDAVGETPRSLVRVPVTTRRESDTASRLSPRERQVAALMARGYSNRQIADELFISIATVERHASNIYNKLGMRSRSLVAVWAVNQGLGVSAIR